MPVTSPAPLALICHRCDCSTSALVPRCSRPRQHCPPAPRPRGLFLAFSLPIIRRPRLTRTSRSSKSWLPRRGADDPQSGFRCRRAACYRRRPLHVLIPWTKRPSPNAIPTGRTSSASQGNCCPFLPRGKRAAVMLSCATRNAACCVDTVHCCALAPQCFRMKTRYASRAGRTACLVRNSLSATPHFIACSRFHAIPTTSPAAAACACWRTSARDGGWIYRCGDRTISVSTVVCGSEPVVKWRVSVEGEPCRFLVLCHLVLGEREYEQAGTLEIDAGQKRFSFRPDPHGVWGRCYPRAVYHLVTSTPGSIERIGGDELLYADGRRRGAGYATLRTLPTGEFDFTVVGSLTDPQRAELLARRHCSTVADATL